MKRPGHEPRVPVSSYRGSVTDQRFRSVRRGAVRNRPPAMRAARPIKAIRHPLLPDVGPAPPIVSVGGAVSALTSPVGAGVAVSSATLPPGVTTGVGSGVTTGVGCGRNDRRGLGRNDRRGRGRNDRRGLGRNDRGGLGRNDWRGLWRNDRRGRWRNDRRGGWRDDRGGRWRDDRGGCRRDHGVGVGLASVQFSEFVLLDEMAVVPSALTANTTRMPP